LKEKVENLEIELNYSKSDIQDFVENIPPMAAPVDLEAGPEEILNYPLVRLFYFYLFRFLNKISIFGQIFHFWQNFLFLPKIWMFGQKFGF